MTSVPFVLLILPMVAFCLIVLVATAVGDEEMKRGWRAGLGRVVVLVIVAYLLLFAPLPWMDGG